MVKNYVLDTSAIFSYTKSEDGAETVGHILAAAQKNKCKVYISFISLMEVYYISWQEKGEDTAKELTVLLKSLPVEIVESSERLILSAGRIKANKRLSVADAIIAATAMEKSAVLIHKDPELENVSQYVESLRLPYKSVKS